MDSGIYLLTFPNDCLYIGRSENIAERFRQHIADMRAGKHSRKIQACYDSWGEPTIEVLLYCHRDHVDLYESIYIRANYTKYNLLNSTIPREVPPEEVEILKRLSTLSKYSTADQIVTIEKHYNTIGQLEEEVKEKEEVISKLRSEGIVLPQEAAAELEYYSNENERLEEELTKLNSRTWFQRLFNL